MLDHETRRRRTRELNRKNFPSEVWFERLLFEYGVTGHQRNPALLGRYFGDFVWFNHKIVIEIDGISHVGKEAYDKRRDDELRAAGFVVCRINMGDRIRAEAVIQRLIAKLGTVPIRGHVTKLPYMGKPPGKKKRKNKALLKKNSLKKRAFESRHTSRKEFKAFARRAQEQGTSKVWLRKNQNVPQAHELKKDT